MAASGAEKILEPAPPASSRRPPTGEVDTLERPAAEITPARTKKAAPPLDAAAVDAPSSSEERYLLQRRRLMQVAQDQVLSLRHLVAQRRSNEDLQNSFLALERRLPEAANALDLVYADERQSAEARLTLGWGSPGLVQILPVSSAGVSAIALSLFGIAARPDAVLRIYLSSVEDQFVIDRWTVPLSRLSAGWTMLTLTRPLVGTPRTLEIRLDLDGQADSAVSLHLGGQQPVRVFQVRSASTNKPLVDSGLSMQIWCGDPFGSRAARADLVVADLQPEAGNGGRFVPMAPVLLAKVARIKTTDAGLSFDPVSFVPYRSAIACHPPTKGVTIARVPFVPGVRIGAVAANVEVGNEKSRPVEFAIAIAADEERARGILEGKVEPTAEEALSNWAKAGFGEPNTLLVDMPRAGQEVKSAFLATRMAQAGGNSFAWARFRNLSIAVSAG